MQFFFEKYKQGNLNAIRMRFSTSATNQLSDNIIKGIYQYLQFITQQQIEMDKPSSSFGNLMAITLRKQWNLVYTQMEKWLPTRFLATKIDIDDKDCMTYMS
jgi:hypothetical protein